VAIDNPLAIRAPSGVLAANDICLIKYDPPTAKRANSQSNANEQ